MPNDNKNKTVLVTGATGFIGSHLSLALARKGRIVVGFSRSLKKPFNSRLFPSGLFIQIQGDIRSRRLLESIFKRFRPEYCFHLAAKATVEGGQMDPVSTYDVNINGAINILELSRCYKLEKVIIASTSHVYGDNPNVPYKEEYFPQPSRPYETSKTCVDLIAQSYANTFGMNVEIPRFVNIYGPGDTNFTRIIPKIMNQVIIDEKVEIWGGDAIRDYLYIDDAISGYLCLLKKNNVTKNKIVNFGTGNPLSVNQLVEKIIKISGRELTIVMRKKDAREMEIKKQYLALSKAQKKFHWEAKISLEDGLSKAYTWYQNFFAKNEDSFC